MTKKVFFCERCGNPVSLSASECPHCGERFDAVRCPKCLFTGKANQFTHGCPVCGYLGESADEKSGALKDLKGGKGKKNPHGKGSSSSRVSKSLIRVFAILLAAVIALLVFLYSRI